MVPSEASLGYVYMNLEAGQVSGCWHAGAVWISGVALIAQ